MSNGHKTNIQRNNVSKIERKDKIQESSLHPSKNKALLNQETHEYKNL